MCVIKSRDTVNGLVLSGFGFDFDEIGWIIPI